MTSYFPEQSKIIYEGSSSRNPMAFKHYNASEKVGDKTMEEHLRFSVAYWHSFGDPGQDPFGGVTAEREWNKASNPVKAAEQRLEAAFEFFTKLGVPYYCFHDRDIAPEGKSITESHQILEGLCKLALKKQEETGVKLLWGTANLFSHARYMSGAATNPDPHVMAYAGAQVKKMLEMTLMLGGENYVFWGGREGYDCLCNTNMKQELDQMAAFLHMAADYAKEIGFKGQLLIEPKPKEPTTHQYDSDSATVMGFLKNYGLDSTFKLNIEANHATLAGNSFYHDLTIASSYNMLGSIDANRGDTLVGWDTDQFPTDLYDTVSAMLVVLKQGGIAPGGFNFDAKVRRQSTDLADMFYAHIGGMDSFALGLKIAHKIREEGELAGLIEKRYSGYQSPLGVNILGGKCSLKELEKYALEKGEPTQKSGHQELVENLMNQYLTGH